MPETSSLIGQPIARIDGRLKVTGAAKFAAEFARPALTYGALIQSTIANGRVVKIDLAAAKSAPGVVDDLPKRPTRVDALRGTRAKERHRAGEVRRPRRV